MIKNLLAVGDCITSGVNRCRGNSYPELLGNRLGCMVTNRGFTMSTSREGGHLLNSSLKDDHDSVIIQFGVADAHLTFKYAPYILYYPDNPFRKTIRNIVKKYKKIAKGYGLNKRFGAYVVSESEYRANYLEMIRTCGDRLIILPESIPQHESFGNPAIIQYNRTIEHVASAQRNCIFIRLFDDFLANQTEYYLDRGHPNERGYDHIASKIVERIGAYQI